MDGNFFSASNSRSTLRICYVDNPPPPSENTLIQFFFHISPTMILLFNHQPYLTWAFFEPSVTGLAHHNFVVIVPMIMKFGTGVKLDVFYTMVENCDVTTFTSL